MGTEKLKFELQLYSTYYNKPPIVEIVFDNKSYFKREIVATKDAPEVIEFEHEVNENESHSLVINRSGKDIKQTVIKNEKIIIDQLLHIKHIEIDEIDIGALVYEGVYTPIYAEPWASQQAKLGNKLPESYKNVTTLGHNGTWTFSFTSPFYMWLLENLY